MELQSCFENYQDLLTSDDAIRKSMHDFTVFIDEPYRFLRFRFTPIELHLVFGTNFYDKIDEINQRYRAKLAEVIDPDVERFRKKLLEAVYQHMIRDTDHFDTAVGPTLPSKILKEYNDEMFKLAATAFDSVDKFKEISIHGTVAHKRLENFWGFKSWSLKYGDDYVTDVDPILKLTSTSVKYSIHLWVQRWQWKFIDKKHGYESHSLTVDIEESTDPQVIQTWRNIPLHQLLNNIITRTRRWVVDNCTVVEE